MPVDIAILLRRDHQDILRGLAALLEARTLPQIRNLLDGVRLGLTAHAEAEDIVLALAVTRCAHPDVMGAMVGHARDQHLAQEGALVDLVETMPASPPWRQRAVRLATLIKIHAAYEDDHVLPTLQDLAEPDVYASLAGRFATERLRQLAMLQPSAPIHAMHLARAG